MGTFFGSDPIRKTMHEAALFWMPPNTPLQATARAIRPVTRRG
jgi:hypothetical protein